MQQSEKIVQLTNDVSMTGQRRRLWVNIETILVEWHVVAQSIQKTFSSPQFNNSLKWDDSAKNDIQSKR